MMYALMQADGTLIEETAATDPFEAWSNSFEYLSNHGCGNLLPFHAEDLNKERSSSVPQDKSRFYCRRYWKDWKGSRDYARKHGWRVVKVMLVATGEK